jgi:hypothetical protein
MRGAIPPLPQYVFMARRLSLANGPLCLYRRSNSYKFDRCELGLSKRVSEAHIRHWMRNLCSSIRWTNQWRKWVIDWFLAYLTTLFQLKRLQSLESNRKMIMNGDLEGGGRDVWKTIPTIASTDWRKPPQSGEAAIRSTFKSSTVLPLHQLTPLLDNELG